MIDPYMIVLAGITLLAAIVNGALDTASRRSPYPLRCCSSSIAS